MKKFTIFLTLNLLSSCYSSSQPRISSEDMRASFHWVPPAEVGGVTQNGVGLERIPDNVLKIDELASPPSGRSVYYTVSTIKYKSRVSDLTTLPTKTIR